MSIADTAPIRPEEAFNESLVASYLREHVRQLAGVAEIRFDQFPGGKANLTYRAFAGNVELVLRRAPLGNVARSGHDMEREYRVLSALWRRYPLAPRAFHYCADPDVMGKPFFVMERRHGHVPRDSWPASWADNDASLRAVAARSLVVALADLHSIDPTGVGLADFGHPDGFVARQVTGWGQRWEAARTRELPDMDRAAALLRGQLPAAQDTCVLHNDFKLDNTMLGEDGQLVAVLDWDMSTRGDPLVDVGTMLAYWADPGAATYPILGGEHAVTPAPFLSRGDLLEQYVSATGFDVSDIRFYEGLALYRIAVIVEQIYARFVAGQTTDPRFAAFEPLAPVLAAAALEMLAKRD